MNLFWLIGGAIRYFLTPVGCMSSSAGFSLRYQIRFSSAARQIHSECFITIEK
jgi:hypothetical protein